MPYFDFIWTKETLDHLSEHGISREDFEHVADHPASRRDLRYIMVVYEQVDALTIVPVTAYEVPEPR